MKKEAIEFAKIAHDGVFRKGTNIPYVDHVIAVGEILEGAGFSPDTVVAGILHDVVEDTNYTIKDIEERFGKKIAKIVDGVTENKSLSPWKVRKENYIAKLTAPETPVESVAVSAADKIHNLTDTYEMWLSMGDDVFNRFNADKEGQSWWYRSMAKVFADRGLDSVAKSIVIMLDEMGM